MRNHTRAQIRSSADEALFQGVEVRSVRGVERLGAVYELEVQVVARERSLPVEALISVPLTIGFFDGDDTLNPTRQIHGVATTVAVTGAGVPVPAPSLRAARQSS
ncbi:MAG: hypothetical protein AAF715_32795, partial [Myxococcota bacterium]